MSTEISSPLLRETVKQLEEIHEEVKLHKVSIPEAISRITAIKHKIQAIALDWMYSKKATEILYTKKRVKKISES